MLFNLMGWVGCVVLFCCNLKLLCSLFILFSLFTDNKQISQGEVNLLS